MSSAVASEMCRVAVQTGNGAVDLVLPANIVVAAVIPSLTDLFGASFAGSSPGVPTDWQLSRVGGPPLSARHSLRDNDVRDGDLLVLSRVETTNSPRPADDVAAANATSLDRHPRWTAATSRATGAIIAMCGTGLATFALVQGNRHVAPAIAGLLSGIAFIGAVICGRVYGRQITGVALGACAITYATAAGYLAVPGDALAPKLMLAAAITATASIVAARGVGGTTVFTTTAAVGLLSAADAGVHLLISLRVEAAGALLAAAATGTLALAARAPLSAAGVGSDIHQTHAIVTGLVCGSSAAAALGAAMAACGGHATGAVFAAIVGVVLVMRSATHADLIQAGALIAGGGACFAAVFLWAVESRPYDAHWISLGAAAAAAAGAAVSAVKLTASPLARRWGDLLQYAALAAMVPVACWVGGVFGMVRGL